MVDPRSLCQIEIKSLDLKRSQLFYEHVFGWGLTPASLHDCLVLQVPDDCPFGISIVPKESTPLMQLESGLVPYFKTDHAQIIAQKAREWGGILKTGPIIVSGYGACWQILDPDGNCLGLFEPIE